VGVLRLSLLLIEMVEEEVVVLVGLTVAEKLEVIPVNLEC
jgi:hypothetical protein